MTVNSLVREKEILPYVMCSRVETENGKSICTVSSNDFHKIWVKLGCLNGVGMPVIHSWLCQSRLKLKSWKILLTNLWGTF